MINSDFFIVLPPNCTEKTIIIGRNSQTEDASLLSESQEIYFYDANASADGQCDGGVSPEISDNRYRLILQKPKPGVWGGDYGANEHNLLVGIICTTSEPTEGDQLLATDIVRLTLATAATAEAALEFIKNLIKAHVGNDVKLNFLVCDPNGVWLVSNVGKEVTTKHIEVGFQRFANNIADLEENGDSIEWCSDKPSGDGTYSLTSMFETIRTAAKANFSRSAVVSVLNQDGISCHWFTATPNAKESVFKPFVFAPNPKISPLTKVPDNSKVTLLHELHAQRKPAAIENLKALEASCIEEVNKYLCENPVANEELDELMKDCVEAEVKFYR